MVSILADPRSFWYNRRSSPRRTRYVSEAPLRLSSLAGPRFEVSYRGTELDARLGVVVHTPTDQYVSESAGSIYIHIHAWLGMWPLIC